MKLEEGMYVRTDRGKIGKFRKEVGDYFELEYPKNVCDLIFKNRLKIASRNIIDLIEVGDYVNGSLVLDITGEYLRLDGESHNKHYFSKHIKSIVTKEYFEQVSYKVSD